MVNNKNQGRNRRKDGAINVPFWIPAVIIIAIGIAMKYFS